MVFETSNGLIHLACLSSFASQVGAQQTTWTRCLCRTRSLCSLMMMRLSPSRHLSHIRMLSCFQTMCLRIPQNPRRVTTSAHQMSQRRWTNCPSVCHGTCACLMYHAVLFSVHGDMWMLMQLADGSSFKRFLQHRGF